MSENDKSAARPDFSKVLGTPRLPEETGPATPRGETAKSASLLDARARTKPDFSNVKAGGSSTATELEGCSTETIYTVKAGDSLSKIAKQVYGDAKLWKRIFEANKDTIKNPDLIHPGQVIKLPRGPERGAA